MSAVDRCDYIRRTEYIMESRIARNLAFRTFSRPAFGRVRERVSVQPQQLAAQ